MYKNKYNATKTFVNGIKFDSKLEVRIYKELVRLKELDQIQFIALQTPYELQEKYENVVGKKIRSINYKCDFVVIDNKSIEYVIDVKGMLTPLFNVKKKLFEYKYAKQLHIIKSIKGLHELLNYIK